MNFFKSVFSDDSDPPGSESNNASSTDSPNAPPSDSSPSHHHRNPSASWKNLIKTLSEKSESVIEIYRRDLQEFGTGLKKEIEVAHDSLETVGHVIDQFGNTVIKGTAQIISQGKEAILESDSVQKKNKKQSNLNSKKYSRFDAQIRAIQGDVNTYIEEPFDLERYNKWKLEFSLEGKNEEIEGLLKENDEMDSVYKRVVPNNVDRETFWLRYYYKVYKVKKAEDIRAKLVRRMSKEEDEDLSWDVEDQEYIDDDDDDVDEEDESKVEKRDSLLQNKMVEESKVDENLEGVQEKGDGSKVDNVNDSEVDSDKKMTMERNASDGKSIPEESREEKEKEKEEEKELEWDEIEDLSSIHEKKAMGESGSASKVDLLKRLSSAAEEEDLSWDIEDDDEPAKA
ncbi:BSD domain-containing protein C22A12.14c isoform X5 [Trifolium pratense]|uniref:BSD domain-containing protein C22A12.14c isoform X4 n=1 Tax=Trifolium pratense TaxID=57577 RepID=UPI001E6956DB|nr:BSD domain-containing protein C22A12.14c isoform X4 [Trifolium pratense]XP_045795212.1 BSD domain-containing protein C22A12.14c isoform X5 [Trifolium pratense]